MITVTVTVAFVVVVMVTVMMIVMMPVGMMMMMMMSDDGTLELERGGWLGFCAGAFVGGGGGLGLTGSRL